MQTARALCEPNAHLEDDADLQHDDEAKGACAGEVVIGRVEVWRSLHLQQQVDQREGGADDEL